MINWFCVEGWDDGGWYTDRECYPVEFRDVIIEFLDSVKVDVIGKDGREFRDWTEFYVDKRKWWKAFEDMMWKYSSNPEIVAVLGHFVWVFRDAVCIDVG